MSINEIIIFVFKDSHDEIIINKFILEKITGFGTGPLLWSRDGEYCIMPKEVIQNVLDLAKSFQQTDLKRTPPVITIMWSQGIPVNNAVGRILIGE